MEPEYQRGDQPESQPIRLLGVVLTPIVIVWDLGRSALFALFALAERLDPTRPLFALAKRLVPWLLKLQPIIEWLAVRVRAVAAWLLRPVIWLVDRVWPVLKVVGGYVARAWGWSVAATKPIRQRVARSFRWVLARWRPIWQQVAEPFRRARMAVGDAVARLRRRR